jgi:hypothetical protein
MSVSAVTLLTFIGEVNLQIPACHLHSLIVEFRERFELIQRFDCQIPEPAVLRRLNALVDHDARFHHVNVDIEHVLGNERNVLRELGWLHNVVRHVSNVSCKGRLGGKLKDARFRRARRRSCGVCFVLWPRRLLLKSI